MKPESDIQHLTSLIGQKLKKFLALSYYFDEEPNCSSIQEIRFEFDGSFFIRVFCGTDGTSIYWDTSDLLPISMGEYGEFKIVDLLKSDNVWNDLIDKNLEKIYLVTSEIEKSIFAVKFVFSNGSELVIANLGDDLRLQKQLALKIIEEEKCEFLDIQETTIE
jgi:hypothetical protein